MGVETAVYIGLGVVLGAGVYAASRGRPDMPGTDPDEMQQTAKEGEPRVQVWGTVRPIRGNIVAAENPPRIIRRKQSGGKGGGSTPRTEHPYRTYAIGVCEGPILGYLRIWRNNKLVYDERQGGDWGNSLVAGSGFLQITSSNEIFKGKVTLYRGGYDQTPDPALEQVFGAGQVPAMRGTAYIVVENEDLTDTNGAVPQWTFEVSTRERMLFGNLVIDSTDATAIPLGGVLLGSGFSASDTLRVTKPGRRWYDAWSRWGSDSNPDAGGLPWSNEFNITENHTEVTETVWPESYSDAETALSETLGREFEITGSDSYTIWLEDDEPENNRGGLSVQVYNEGSPTLVSDVVLGICGQAGIPSGLVDPSGLGGLTIEGVSLSPANPAADTLTSICELLQVDVVNAGGMLTFKPRGGSSVADISDVDAVDDGGPVHEAERRDRIEIPRRLILEYYDAAGGLNADTQTSTRTLDSRAVSEVKRKTSVLMTAEEAVERAHIAHKVLIEEQRGEWEFSLPDSYLYVTVGDVVMFDGYRLRVTETEIEEGLQKYKAVHDRASAYTSDAVPSPPGDPSEPPSLAVGQTVLHFIDSHILRDADDRLGYYVAITGVSDTWRGALVELSTDGGDTYPDSIEAGTDAIAGELTEELQAHSRYYPDTVNTLSVELIRDDMDLESATLAQMMNRRNLAIVGDEILNFGDVEEDSQGHWQLSNLLRGRKGSHIETHAAGTRFILLERQQLWFIDADATLLDQEITFRVTSLGSDAGTTQTVTFTGQSQQERQPAYLTAERDAGDVVVDWQGVGRLGGGTHVAMGSFFQHYRVTINGTDYTTTDQQLTVTDPGGALTIEVRQVNSLTGAGPAAQVTI